jgi:formylglycine-generating enzyme
MGGVFGEPEPPSEFTVSKDGNNLNVGFGTVVGQTYSIEKSTTLAPGSWVEILSNGIGSGSVRTSTDAGAGELAKCFYRIRYSGAPMVLIPAGSFEMGNQMDPNEGSDNELPVHTVYVSAFYMDKYEVSKALWDEVADWAVASGYDINAASASGNASNHPAYDVTWYEAVKWCNARSQKEGLTPCYTVLGSVYKTGSSVPDCNFGASGYRLPTEAEWEKAARGGLSGKRFPWGDTINHSYANYYNWTYSYESPQGAKYHPDWDDVWPFTSPVGSFEPNGHGLYDMAGNVWEWCWDRYSSIYYSSSPGNDPRGPDGPGFTVVRGGGWDQYAFLCRTADRNYGTPGYSHYASGFRCARSSVP